MREKTVRIDTLTHSLESDGFFIFLTHSLSLALSLSFVFTPEQNAFAVFTVGESYGTAHNFGVFFRNHSMMPDLNFFLFSFEFSVFTYIGGGDNGGGGDQPKAQQSFQLALIDFNTTQPASLGQIFCHIFCILSTHTLSPFVPHSPRSQLME